MTDWTALDRTDLLKVPALLVPCANQNNRQHSPNEHLRLDHLFQGIRATVELMGGLEGRAPANPQTR